MENSKINIIIIEPSEIIVSGLISILKESNRINIVNTYSDVAKFQDSQSVTSSIDAVIINPSLVSYGKRGAIRTLFPNSNLIGLLYSYIDRETLAQFDETIEVCDKPSKIIFKLEQISSNNELEKPMTEGSSELSEREIEILVAVAKGMINKEIADLYNLSVHTIISHRKNISRKTGIKSVSGFVVYALLNNYIEEHEVL